MELKKRGKMRRNPFKKGIIPSGLVIMILTTIIITSLVPKATAAPTTAITLIDPPSGHVGTEVRVNGTIDTANGTYILRWDERLNVTIGNATEYDAYSSFIVPQTPGIPDLGREVLIELIDNKTGSIANATFRLYTEYCIKADIPSPPFQLQEGQETDIWVNVTGGVANTVYVANITVKDPPNTTYWTTVSLTNTTTTGYGDGKRRYPTDFSAGAHTNYTGTYHMAFNETFATANFTVCLTDRTEYVREYLTYPEQEETGEVTIQGSGYDNETITINITYYNKTAPIQVEGYPKQENASNGIVTHKWKIPNNATLATYDITLTSDTIEKPVKDTQTFTIIQITVSCQAQNKYDNKSLAGVSIDVSAGILPVGSRITNETGWTDFQLDRDYYSFGAYWQEVEVGSLSSSLEGNPVDYVLRIKFHIKCKLANITINVRDKDGPLPFINVTLTSAALASRRIPSFQTNHEGLTSSKAFTDIVYRIEARRYGHLFFNQSIGNLTETVGNLTDPFLIICPTHTLFIHASDSKEHPIQNATVQVIEWSSERIAGEGKTDQWGSIRIDCTFGRYKVRVYNYSEMLEQTIILNETVVDVIRDQFYLVLNCRTVNLDLSVKVIDYFGQPIPNAKVILNLTTTEGMGTLNLITRSDGTAFKNRIPGGDYRISLYVAGRLCGIKSLYLDESREIVLQVSDYVMVGGYPLKSNQLITGVTLTIVVVFCASALIYRRRSKKPKND